ncbi:MAG: hypothetical protein OEX04_10735 [Acidimicrobiia bacterium]|nr:hypothetical protein [Acidimicrobiia bacterium]MDH4307945.1 hypothetical protein [Acidimicrobiia bacterium]MDH5292059.1 hypothetical protein [Acidimicrobiia bacterium]
MSTTISHRFRTLTIVSVATVAAIAVPAAMMPNDGPSNVPAEPATVAADPCADVGQGLPDSIEFRKQACREDVAQALGRSASVSSASPLSQTVSPRGFDPCANVGRGLPESIELRTRACREDVAAAAARSATLVVKPAGDSDPCADVGQGLPDSIEFRKQACREDVAAGRMGG